MTLWIGNGAVLKSFSQWQLKEFILKINNSWPKPMSSFTNTFFFLLYHCQTLVGWLVEWCFTPLSTVFQSYHGDSSHYSCLSWVSPVLGWGSEVSCPKTLPQKNPEDPVRLEPRTPGLRVKHFTTEPRRTPIRPR